MSKSKDIILLCAVLFLFILNPVFSLLNDKIAIPFVLLAVLAAYLIDEHANPNEANWKNPNIRCFFTTLNSPGKFDLYAGIAIILLGKYAARILGIPNEEIFTIVFFLYYIIKCIVKAVKYIDVKI